MPPSGLPAYHPIEPDVAGAPYADACPSHQADAPFPLPSPSQVNLTWLDLSFNKLTKIEGLDTLTKLVDLSLFNNEIEVMEGLDALTALNVFSIGEDLVGLALG